MMAISSILMDAHLRVLLKKGGIASLTQSSSMMFASINVVMAPLFILPLPNTATMETF